MNKALKYTILLLFACVFTAAAQEVKPKYIFLFIGDGMSFPQRMAADEYSRITAGKPLAINQMKYQAVTTTRSANSFITDSAASGTAIACGEKTGNGMIGVGQNGKPLTSVASAAKARGRKVGIVTSVTINHATPAAFYAHNKSRSNYYQIALDMLTSGFDYFGGGGIAKYNSKSDKLYRGDIYELAEKAGYFVSREGKKFKEVKPEMSKVMSFGAENDLVYAINAREKDLRLADFVRQAIGQLDNPNGFFIMAEGGKIDWLCHANDAGAAIIEVIDFDNAVSVALDFARKHPAETLIVVTGDHETGGLTLGFAGTAYKSYIERIAHQKGTVSVFTQKLKSLETSGKVNFDRVIKVITEHFGMIFPAGKSAEVNSMELTSAEISAIENAYNKQFADGKWVRDKKKNRVSYLEKEVVRIFNNKAALAWTSGAHTALPVNTTAEGVGAEKFVNMIDNTDISKKLKELL